MGQPSFSIVQTHIFIHIFILDSAGEILARFLTVSGFFFLIDNFIYCWAGTFSSCGERGLLRSCRA